MRSDQIRSEFFDFFHGHGHLLQEPGPVISDDDTVLFTGAGMFQFKPYFLSERHPPHPRLMSTQPCVRTVDIGNIGYTSRHSTSFEMLGSFSFGDYFKIEAMRWALDLLVDGYGLERQRLWVTVLRDDEETFGLWRRLGVPEERIQRLGIKDNFWSMGVPGPSGPNSEIFYDRGSRFGSPGGPAVNSERYLEVWNLVFMHLLRGGSDEEILGELPGKNVDTGLGLDRLAMVMQDVDHIQQIDLHRPLLESLLGLTGHDEPTLSHRVVADHLRTSLLLISCGVMPGNDGRRYVLRRLLRRAIRHLRVLGVTEPALGELTGNAIVTHEEVGFGRTLRVGSRLLEKSLASVHDGQLPGEVAFRLHDRHGFPIELTSEISREAGVEVDVAEFRRLMDEHRRLSAPR
jgi:alanyl-tRNA synthetase